MASASRFPAVAPFTMAAVMPSMPCAAPRALFAAAASMLDRLALTLLMDALARLASTSTTSSSLLSAINAYLTSPWQFWYWRTMQCPVCGIENVPSADRCDCGYAFTLEGAAMAPIGDRAPTSRGNATTRLKIFPTIAALAVGIWMAKCLNLFSPTNKNRRQIAQIGSIVSVSMPTVCAPSKDALHRIMEAAAIDREEFLIAAGREARTAGWEGAIFIAPPDNVKVLDTTFTTACVRLMDEKFERPREGKTECWVPIEAITYNQERR
jgi:hypothetical protein